MGMQRGKLVPAECTLFVPETQTHLTLRAFLRNTPTPAGHYQIFV